MLGLATGSTPLLLYRELITLKLDWREVTMFNLDENIGISPQHPQSYHNFMWENLFQHVNIASKNVHIPDGLAKDAPAFCDRYEKKINPAGGIDLQVLGIGVDGHIGFNEPTSSLASRTRIKTLTRQARKDNARFFGSEEQVPHHVITMGIGTIMETRQCLLLSVLQQHPNTKLCLDAEVSSRLKRGDYYRWAYDHKPEWQQFLYSASTECCHDTSTNCAGPTKNLQRPHFTYRRYFLC